MKFLKNCFTCWFSNDPSEEDLQREYPYTCMFQRGGRVSPKGASLELCDEWEPAAWVKVGKE
jgi:hypothetical protein